MSLIKEFHYSNVFQRRVLYINTFFTLIIFSFIAVNLSFNFKYYFYFAPVLKNIFTVILLGLFVGNLFSQFLFSVIKKYRILYILVELLFIVFVLFYLLKNIVDPAGKITVFNFFVNSQVYFMLYIFFLASFLGAKLSYFFKISCGDFIDEKQAINTFILFILFGLSTGIFISIFVHQNFLNYIDKINLFVSAIPLIIIITAFFIKLPFQPEKKFAKKYIEHTDEQSEKNIYRNDLFFYYMNFTFIFIYSFLSYETIARFYQSFDMKLLYFGSILPIIALGFIFGKILKNSFWNVYIEMLFPVVFIFFIFITYNFHQESFYFPILSLIPLLLSLGFSLYQSLYWIIQENNHEKRFQIINFSFFILPVPIIIALGFITYTFRWYFILIYLIAALNILIPGLFLLNIKIKAYKKIVYFVFSLFFVPSVVFLQFYYNIPFSLKLYTPRVENFSILENTNFYADFIKHKGIVKLDRKPVFILNDNVIRNYKRALIPLKFLSEEKAKKLFFDGNQKFFRNPIIGKFKNSTIIQPIPDEAIDNKKIPLSTSIKYFTRRENRLNFIKKNKGKYKLIVDMPNLLEQNTFLWQSSKKFIMNQKKILLPKGIYSQVLNLSYCDKKIIEKRIKNILESYKYSNVYLFSDILLIIASDDKNNFTISSEKYQELGKMFQQDNFYSKLFFNELHLFSHQCDSNLIKTEIFSNRKSELFNSLFLDNYLKHNSLFFDNLAKNIPYYQLNFIKNKVLNFSKILTILKETELAETKKDFLTETKNLFLLRNYGEYRPFLRKYILQILRYKEKYYFDVAKNFEKKKQWDKAQILYRAILTINPNNFEANYKMGFLSLTLQNLPDSFKYLKKAMGLNQNHPKVLYQMGILSLLNGKTEEAIVYFKRAIEFHEKTASLFFYLGLAYQKLNRMPEAENYYLKAKIQDPNDEKIKSKLDEIKKIKEEQRDKWKAYSPKNQNDAEIGEDIPLPVNKSARDVRLKDNEKVKE